MSITRKLSEKSGVRNVGRRREQRRQRREALDDSDVANAETDAMLAHRPDLLYVDLHLVHEVTSAQAFDGLRVAGLTVRRPALTLAPADHHVPTADPARPHPDAPSPPYNPCLSPHPTPRARTPTAETPRKPNRRVRRARPAKMAARVRDSNRTQPLPVPPT